MPGKGGILNVGGMIAREFEYSAAKAIKRMGGWCNILGIRRLEANVRCAAQPQSRRKTVVA